MTRKLLRGDGCVSVCRSTLKLTAQTLSVAAATQINGTLSIIGPDAQSGTLLCFLPLCIHFMFSTSLCE